MDNSRGLVASRVKRDNVGKGLSTSSWTVTVVSIIFLFPCPLQRVRDEWGYGVGDPVENPGHSKFEFKIFFMFMFWAPDLVPRGPSPWNLLPSCPLNSSPPHIPPRIQSPRSPTQFCSILTVLLGLKIPLPSFHENFVLSTPDNL